MLVKVFLIEVFLIEVFVLWREAQIAMNVRN